MNTTMISPNAEEVFILSDSFHICGNAVRDYINQNKGKLGDDDRNALFDFQIALLQQAADINMLGTAMVFDDVSKSLKDLNDIANSVKKSVKKAMAVQNAINIATSIVDLGTAILSKNPKEIGIKTMEAFNAVKG